MSFQNLTTISSLTMTSRAVADVTGKQHKHVLADIRKMLNELGKDEPSFRHIYQDGMNRDQTEYVLDKELTITLTAGYSTTQRHAIIKRWLELEGQQQLQPQVPMSLGDMLVAQAEAFRAVERKLALVEAQNNETASRLDQIETAETHFTIIGWSSLNGRQAPTAVAASMGKKATKYCRANGIQTGSVPDARYGRANTYPKNVLDYLFGGDLTEG